ncbi:glycosyltransferase family 2 protein [Radiobacillus sp. PE A8.2]|uniref:glycosyltransferase family 2 protein n=1 Tax=Radiobacillus sp. PE A8.2 TaxID=3380349 RepID=UPI00388CF376
MKPSVSIIFPVKNEGENVQSTLHSLFSCESNYLFEAIIVNDASDDQCCSFIPTYPYKEKIQLIETNGIGAANARNLGAAKALGEHLIFCDAHLNFENWWIDRLIDPLITGKTDAVTPAIADMQSPDVIGYGQTLTSALRTIWNKKQPSLFETAVLPGGCLAMHREVFDAVGGFETRFKTWGHEDVELSIKLWLFGFRCHVQPDVTILHLFRKSHPYRISNNDIYYNLLRMAYLHFNADRIQKCKSFIQSRRKTRIENQLVKDGVLRQREVYFQKRKYDDDWYFQRFQISF